MLSLRRRPVTAGLIAVVCAVPAAAQNVHPTPGPEIRATALTGAIRIDGRLDEDIWRTAPAATDFRQNQPREGQPATQRTEVRFAFDAEALYVGARMFDDSGAAGVRTQLARRDASLAASDYVQVIVDTYHDHIGRLFFLVNPSGVRQDANGLGGGGDASWDPVWEVKTTIDSLGWTAEMRIPFAEMRYPQTAEAQTWGLQIWRQVSRLNELSQWSFWGLTESGGPPRFGHLQGLVIEGSPGRGELLPYVVGRSTNVPRVNPSDPFEDPNAMDGRVGVDARILLTSNLTLNATINPDFGQVEVDPAVVNLGVFETFLEEKRPFFVEGAGYFGFGSFNCYFCSNASSLTMLSTRRIGRQPQMAGNAFTVDSAQYADIPENTAILGAAKLTGRTRSGWSIGIMDAVTRRERAPIQLAGGARGESTVEPFTNFFVGRFAKDLRGGATQMRGIVTSVNRDLENQYMRDRLTSRASAVGIGTDTYWRNRAYRLMAQFAFTDVTGDTGAIRRLQVASQRYMQRPDRTGDRLDPSRTSLRGFGGYTRLSRETGKVLAEFSTNFRTAGFDNNDLTFLGRTDYFWMNANILPQWTRPTSWYRNLFFIVGAQQQYNFDGDLTDRQLHLFGYIQPPNYWNIQTFYIHRPELLDERLNRGGPLQRRPGVNFWSTNASTDSRKRFVFSVNQDFGCTGDGDCDRNTSISVQWRPRSNVSISTGPFIGFDKSNFQFITAVADTSSTSEFYGQRYVFARLIQRTLSMNTRVNVTFTPNLTFELFVQPFIASGDYSAYRQFASPRESRQLVYGVDVGSDSLRPKTGAAGSRDTVIIYPHNGSMADSIKVGDRDFTLRSLRGNAVLRWEYRPGSTLFVVWVRSTESTLERGVLNAGTDAGALLSGPTRNIFLVKVNYRIGL